MPALEAAVEPEMGMATGMAADPNSCSNKGTLAALGLPVKGRFLFQPQS